MNSRINFYFSKTKKYWPFLCFTLANLVALLFYILGSKGEAPGFPLDDAWIHQTYARNLAENGMWSFSYGRISGGSTSPLWTLLLSIGYLINEHIYYYWTICISIVCYGLLAILLTKCLAKLRRVSILEQILFFLIIISEWHLIWAVFSGMETILYSLGTVLFAYLILKENRAWWLIGLVIGFMLWIRPDGLTLLGPAISLIIVDTIEKKQTFKDWIKFTGVFVSFCLLYVLFNFITTGNILPNTFYAKQTEYQELYQVSLAKRIFSEFSIFAIGSGVVLIPGFLFGIYESVRTKNIKILILAVWVIGFGILYAIRLPVTYQHGRYMIPVLPIYLLVGFWGSRILLENINKIKWRKPINFGFVLLIVVLSFGFFYSGFRAYHEDLKAINQLMVEPAKWISRNTNSADLIAVHDIGAMGYFSNREIIDLAGLVNPEVIPFIRDESKLYGYMKSKDVSYFVGFRDWYSSIDLWGENIYTFHYDFGGTDKQVVVVHLR